MYTIGRPFCTGNDRDISQEHIPRIREILTLSRLIEPKGTKTTSAGKDHSMVGENPITRLGFHFILQSVERQLWWLIAHIIINKFINPPRCGCARSAQRRDASGLTCQLCGNILQDVCLCDKETQVVSQRDPSTCSCCNGTIPTRQVGDVVECLQALLQFSFHRLGVPYKTDNANQQEIVNHLAFIGMVVKVSKTDGDTYCITSLTKKWAAGGKYGEQAAMLPSGSIPGAMCSTANDAGYIIVETTNR
eukprot:gene25651-1718_t